MGAELTEKPLIIKCQRDETEEQATARAMLSPALQSAWTLHEYVNSPVELDLQALIDCIEKQVGTVKEGNLERIDQMLLSQAHTLDAIANNLFRRARNQEYMSNLESFLKLGLRAQSQCRANLEALANIKNPKTYLSQTNIAHNQQVNNSIPAKKRNPPIELLETSDGERLDPGTQQETVRDDPGLAAVDEQHRAENKRRQG